MVKKILVIDDDESVRKSFMLALEDTKFKVVTAVDGEEGVRKFNELNPDMVFLDLKMPKMNGTEVLTKIRKKNKDVPVYIVTAFHKEFFTELNEVKNKQFKFELLNKPVTGEQIVMVAKSILEDPQTYNE